MGIWPPGRRDQTPGWAFHTRQLETSQSPGNGVWHLPFSGKDTEAQKIQIICSWSQGTYHGEDSKASLCDLHYLSLHTAPAESASVEGYGTSGPITPQRNTNEGNTPEADTECHQSAEQ